MEEDGSALRCACHHLAVPALCRPSRKSETLKWTWDPNTPPAPPLHVRLASPQTFPVHRLELKVLELGSHSPRLGQVPRHRLGMKSPSQTLQSTLPQNLP